MYIHPETANAGLKQGQSWPNENYKAVAAYLVTENPSVTKLDHVVDIVQAVLTIPEEEIGEITLAELRKRFPNLGI